MSIHKNDNLKNRRTAVSTVLTLCLICLLMLMTACKSEGNISPDAPSATPAPTSAPTAAPTPTATPIPTPTPIVDVPTDRYDASVAPRTAADEVPVVNYVDSIEGVLNPFYSSSETDRAILELTQIKLLDVDENGIAAAGIDRPCLAYSIELLPENTSFAGGTDGLPENWKAYRIVLKEGITFRDGTPVTADDVLFTVRTLGDLNYDGPSTISKLNILGMEEYHTRISNETRLIASECVAAGINEDGTMPADFPDSENWKKVWDCMDEAGTRMAQDLIDYYNAEYGNDTYVQVFLSSNMTFQKVSASEELRTVYAMVLAGYLKRQNYNAGTNKIRDSLNNTVHDLNEEVFDASTFWGMIKEYCGYNLSTADGINYEAPYTYTGKYLEDYIAEVYCERNMKETELSGVKPYTVEYEDGAVRQTLDVLIDENENLADFNFYIAEKSFYEGNERSNDLHCAGQYYVSGAGRVKTEVKDEETGETVIREDKRVELTANDDYMLGSPLTHYVVFTTEPAEAEE